MGLLDSVSTPRQQVAYLFPEVTSGGAQGLKTSQQTLQELFVFQFWPSQVTDSYTPNWATKQIPGASHPLYQWVSGSGRNISFTANFVAEIQEAGPLVQPFNERIAGAAATSVGRATDTLTSAGFLPSSRYVVNVAAALAALQRYLYPSYNSPKGITKPPKKLILVLPGTKLGRADNVDGILCILKAANVTMESWFPSGELRAASVGLQFSEIIQYTAGSGTAIRYIGAETYDKLANQYTIRPDIIRRRVS